MVSHDGERSWPAGEALGEGARDQSSERYSSMFIHHPHATYSVDPRGLLHRRQRADAAR